MSKPLPLGRVVITDSALREVPPGDILCAVRRHATGDWGDLCPEDQRANNNALEAGDRILSVYHTDGDVKFWIITEWDRSVTTILLPSDY